MVVRLATLQMRDPLRPVSDGKILHLNGTLQFALQSLASASSHDHKTG